MHLPQFFFNISTSHVWLFRLSTKKQSSDGKGKYARLGSLLVHMVVSQLESTPVSAEVLGSRVENIKFGIMGAAQEDYAICLGQVLMYIVDSTKKNDGIILDVQFLVLLLCRHLYNE